MSFPSHDLQGAWQFLVQPPLLLVEHRVKEAHGTGEETFAGGTDMELSDETSLRPPREWWSSPGHVCSLQARKLVLKWEGFKSWSCPIPCSPPLSVLLHLISCGLRIQHLGEMPQICLFAQVFQMFHLLTVSSGYLHKGSTSCGERLFLPILLLF